MFFVHLWCKRAMAEFYLSKFHEYRSAYINGVSKVPPRRVKFTYPNEGVHNYENLKSRLDVMAEDPKFGDIQNEYGRLWWDKE